MIIQVIEVSLWPVVDCKWCLFHMSQDLGRIIIYIASFSVPIEEMDNKSMLIEFLINLIAFLIVLSFISGQMICYLLRRRYFKKTLYVTRFVLEVFATIFIYPSATFAGQMFACLLNKDHLYDHLDRTQVILFAIISVIIMIFLSFVAYNVNMYIQASIYMPTSPLISFNMKPFFTVIILDPFFSFATHLFSYFPNWLQHPLYLIHFAFMIYTLYIFLKDRPFLLITMNGYFVFGILMSTLLDFLRLVMNFVKSESETVGIICFICFFIFLVISVIFPIVYYKLQNKKMMNNLTIREESVNDETGHKVKIMPSDEERIERFIDLGLDKRERQALVYYDFIITNHIVGYLDFFVTKFVCTHHRSTDVLEHCIKTLAFFPPQIRTLNTLYNEFVKRHDLTARQTFLMYQVQKLKMMRQSSSSSLALERLKELKAETKELECEITEFWTLQKFNYEYIGAISKKILKTKALWEEAVIQFPSSSLYREEYMNFNLECESNYVHGVFEKHMIDMIESGRNFNVDHCFRQFVRNFPEFLKKGIVDLKGNINKNIRKPGGGNASVSHTHSSNSTGSHHSSTLNSTNTSMTIDLQVEEGLGKALFPQSKIRLGLQKATMEQKAYAHSAFLFTCLALFVVGFVLFLFVFIYFMNYFDSSKQTVNRVRYILDTRLYTATAAIALLFHWGNQSNVIDIASVVASYQAVDDPTVIPLIDYHERWDQSTMNFIMESEEEFTRFRSSIAELSESGVDVYHYMGRLFEENTVMCYCYKNGTTVADCKGENLKKILAFVSMESSLLLTDSDIQHIFKKNQNFCSIFSSLLNIPEAFQELLDTITEIAGVESQNSEKLIDKIKIIIPIVYAVVCIALFLIMFLRYYFEIAKFGNLILKLPANIKKDCEKPIRIDTDESKQERTVSTITGLHIPIIYCITILLGYVLLTVLTFLALQNIGNYNKQFDYLKAWTANSVVRKSLLVEICLWETVLIIMDNPLVQVSYIDKDALKAETAYMFERLDYRTNNLMADDGSIPSVAGVDSQIDDLFLKETCPTPTENASYHDMYRCSSSQQLFQFFLNTITTIEFNLAKYNNEMKDDITVTIFHLSSNHLIPILNQIDQRFIELSDKFSNEFFIQHLIYLILEVVLAIVLVIIQMLCVQFFNRCYSTVKIFMRRVSPAALVADSDFVDYLFDNTKKGNTSEMSTDQGIIHNTADSVLCVDSNFVIEIMNPAVTHTFGYSPEQMLGQSVLNLFPEEARESVDTQLQLMMNKQASLTYDGHTVCLSDNDTQIHCAITILGMTESNDDTVTSFVILLRDESALLEQQEQAENAKKQSEQLLYQILPRDIVIRLNQGEKDISFSVPSATIMFIDIVKFSEYASALTPQEIMGNLSLLFGGFDQAIAKFDRLIKIKLIGDVYMCAGGLFTPDDAPVVHCEQMVKFAIECLQVLEETNVKLNAVLNVRIGINTGGPLIAGVLGTDKPTFDIIGDPINVASRLQSTDIAGRIQISANSYNLIKDLDFQIEPRGEIYLKGKGNQMAYLVTPQTVTSGIESYLHESSELHTSSMAIASLASGLLGSALS